MHQISRLTFDLLAGYSRDPNARFISHELAWFSDDQQRVLAILIRDKVDDDFGGIVLGRDKIGRFRCVHVSDFFDTPDKAAEEIGRIVNKYTQKPSTDFEQGDEPRRSIDLFSISAPETVVNPSFKVLNETAQYRSAKKVLQNLMHYYQDADGNLVEQFQTTGFDARIWELYLFATLTELGFRIDRTRSAPDFLAILDDWTVGIEAVTVNPAQEESPFYGSPPPKGPAETYKYLRQVMPMRFGSALVSKLQKRYWEKPHLDGHPFVIAIQDFHMLGSMAWTSSGLPVYLYGKDYKPTRDENGKLKIEVVDVKEHVFGAKVIPSGFFNLPGSEYVAGILANPLGTLAKFNRMGIYGQLQRLDHLMIWQGTCYDHDPNSAEPEVFSLRVGFPYYRETWRAGLGLYHNPNALHPIPEELFPDIAHHYLRDDGQLVSVIPEFHPLGSNTHNIFLERAAWWESIARRMIDGVTRALKGIASQIGQR